LERAGSLILIFSKYLEPIVLWKMKGLSNIGKYPTYLHSFDFNYIVFRNVEMFRFLFFVKEKIVKGNIEFQK
jgi:hypothetical protein